MSGRQTLHRIPRHRHAWLAWLLSSQALVIVLWWGFGWRIGLPAMMLSHVPFWLSALLPRATLYGPVLARLPVQERVVWLTIDDGPSDDTVAILDLLDRHGMRVTFFLVGARAAARPDLVHEILRRGHDIGNHSQTHPQAWFWALGPRRMAREIGQAQATLAALTGTAPRWFRSVVGMTNPFVAAPLRRHGLARVAWGARGYDAVRGDPAAVVARIERDLVPGVIVLLHEGAPHGRSVETIERLLQRLQALGYRTVLPDAVPSAPGGIAADAVGS